MKKTAEKLDFVRRHCAGGLDEKEFIALYNMGNIKRVAAQQYLFRKGDREAAFYLVLKGTLEIRSDDGQPVSAADLLTEGTWIGELKLSGGPQRLSSVMAREDVTLLAFDATVFRGLAPQFQWFIHNKLNEQAVERAEKMRRCYTRAAATNAYYANYISGSLHRQAEEYGRSEIILGILNNVPRLPVHVAKLINMLLMNKASVREVTQLAKEDPSLVGEILKTINSSYYSLQGKVSDLHHAIAYLGFNQVYQIVVANGLHQAAGNSPEAQELQHHCVAVSHLVAEICQTYDRQKAPLLMTAALLHDIGKSVIWLLRKHNPKWAFFINILNHAQMGGMLLRKWNIPDSLCKVIEYQSYPEFSPPGGLPPQVRENVAALYLAHAASEYLEGSFDPVSAHPFIDDYVQLLNLPEASFGDLMEWHFSAALKKKMNTLPTFLRNMLMPEAASQASSTAGTSSPDFAARESFSTKL